MKNNERKDTKQSRELAECKKQAEEYLNNWKRERANLLNYKKDEEKKNLELWVFQSGLLATMDTMRDFLTGISRFKDKKDLPGFSEFMEVKRFQQLIEQAWEQIGIKKILVEGQRFDPKLHEALDQEAGGEQLVEVAPGYAIDGKVIRPARVKIIK